MDDTLLSALLITAIGMSLLFMTLAFFYGLLWLLTAIVRDRPGAGRQERAPAPDPEAERTPAFEAAAIAVALARARSGRKTATSTPVAGISPIVPTDPWWSLHHQRYVNLSSSTRSRR